MNIFWSNYFIIYHIYNDYIYTIHLHWFLKFTFYPLKLIIVIHFIPFNFLYFILRFSHINTYNWILTKILRFNFNKLHHYNHIVDTFEMSLILNIFWSNYFIIYHIYILQKYMYFLRILVYFKITFHTIIIIKLIYFIRFKFNKLQHYNRFIDTIVMSQKYWIFFDKIKTYFKK